MTSPGFIVELLTGLPHFSQFRAIEEYSGLPPPDDFTTSPTQLAHWQDCPFLKYLPFHSFAVFTIRLGNTPDCRIGRNALFSWDLPVTNTSKVSAIILFIFQFLGFNGFLAAGD
jgi:hypothetical protein